MLLVCIFLGAWSGLFASSLELSAEGQARERELEAAWAIDLEPSANSEKRVVAYKSPVQRVVSLLQKMRSELEAEASNESEMYDKMVCWCETNDKKKTKAIADADAADKDSQAEIERRAARFGELATEIQHMKDQVASDSEALKQAMGIREGEAGEFRSGEKDMMQAINNLSNAMDVLSKQQAGTSLMQLDASLFSSIRAVLRDAALKFEMLLGDKPRDDDPNLVTVKLQGALLQMDHMSEGDRKAQIRLHSLLSALDTSHSAGLVDVLPLKFAERRLAESVKEAAGSSHAFLQAGDRQPYYKSYSPRSGAIFGILKQMKEEFESQLSVSQRTEMKGSNDYEAMAKAKRDQVEVGKKKLDDMKGEHAANQKALSDAKEDLDLTRQQRAADVEFLRNLKTTCQGLDKEWQTRSKTRSAELLAVSGTLKILTEDDVRDLMAKAVSLLQERSSAESGSVMRMARLDAAWVLRRAAQSPVFEADDLLAAWHSRRAGSPSVGPKAELSTLAVTVQLDAFSKVKAVMEKMIGGLKNEQQEEVKLKAYCEQELDKNAKATYTKNTEKGNLEDKIESLESLMKKLEDEIAAAKQQIADTKGAMKEASHSREAANSVFQTTVADQRAMQSILTKALARLRAFYRKAESEAFVQQTPPVQFAKYKKNAGSSPVLGLIAQISEDSQQLEKEAVESEAKSQADYEMFVKDSNGLIAELYNAITEKGKANAAAKLGQADSNGDHESTVAELESLAVYNADLHGQCDFVLKSFSIRQKARLQEIQSIQHAKATLAGAMG